MSEQSIDWKRIAADLRAPFAPAEVEWRPATGKGGAGQHVQLVAYVGAAAVMERLDAVVGLDGWSFRWEPIVIDKGEVQAAKGILTVQGVVREDVGTASNWEPTKGAVSDALKRCAVGFGVARYLRDIPQVGCTLDEKGNIPAAMLTKLQEALRRRQAPRSA